MTVLYCLSHINKSLQWEWFAREMKDRGINQVYVLFDIGEGSVYLHEDLKSQGITSYLIPHRGKLSYISNIRETVKLIKMHNASVVHSSLPTGNIVGQTAARICGIKARITTCENASWAHDFKNRKQEWIDRYTFRLADKIIATSEIAAKYLREHWTFNKSKLEVIYHGLPIGYDHVTSERIEAARTAYKIDPSKFNVGIFSRFEFWKGHGYILEAARLLKDDGDIIFHVFGNGGSYYKEALVKRASYNLANKVIFHGFAEDSLALYKTFNVHLHVPVDEYVETGGITIIEGMMCQVPQVLTRSGYAWQISSHMDNSFVVPFKDASAIAEGIIWMKNNRETAAQLAKKAYLDARRFSVKQKVDAHIDLYNRLIS